MNSRQRRTYLRLLDRKTTFTKGELITYSNLFCKRYPDPWLHTNWTPEEAAVFDDRSDSIPWD
jgi:hypothetical protein